jgi:hypothetical protein
MSDTAPLKTTLKPGPGYEVPFFSLEGSTPAEFIERLDACGEAGVFEALARAHARYVAAYTAVTSLGAQPVAAPQGAWQQAAQSSVLYGPTPAEADGPSCPHGPTIKRGGTRKDGKPWSGYFCPDRVKGCGPFNKDGSSWD